MANRSVVMVVMFSAGLGVVGCARGYGSPPGDAGVETADAVAGSGADAAASTVDAQQLLEIDAAPPDAAPPPGPAHLLLTEVMLAPSGGEFVEIFNPGAIPVDLADYYLSDAPAYFRLPTGPPTLDGADFLARFPADRVLAAGAVLTVAISTAAAFTLEHAVPPTLALRDGDMRIVAEAGTGTLTNDGEFIALFYWDGASDRVVDVDLLHAGKPTIGNRLTAKNGIALDGPDVGADTTAYASDAATMPLQAVEVSSGSSTRRIVAEAGHETQAGTGNGVDGDDETSEVTSATWSAPGLPDPGVVTGTLQ